MLASHTCDSLLLDVYSMGSKYSLSSAAGATLLRRSCVFIGDSALPATATLR